MADCEFCGSGVDVEGQDMGEGRVMLLCASCRANIAAGEERDKERDETMASEELRVVDSDGQHVRLMWGDVEIVASVATGMLQMVVMGPSAYNIQATEGIRDEIGTTLMVGARKIQKIQKIQTPSVRESRRLLLSSRECE